MSKDLRIVALNVAMSDSDCNTVAVALGKASEIFRFLNECPGQHDLRMLALTAASTVAMRQSEESPDVNLISDARVFLDFLKTTSSEHPSPCATAEPRSEVE